MSLEEAVNTVDTLDEIALPDYQPCIEGMSFFLFYFIFKIIIINVSICYLYLALNGSIVYKVSMDTNFEDKTAFVTGISKYIEEAAMHAQLVFILFLFCKKIDF